MTEYRMSVLHVGLSLLGPSYVLIVLCCAKSLVYDQVTYLTEVV